MALSKFIYLDPQILSEVQLLEIYDNCRKLLLEGKTTTSWTGEGTGASKQFVAPILDIMAEARMALKYKNPQQYGYFSNKTKVFFY